jgi:malonyl-CoA O-methyltransferase
VHNPEKRKVRQSFEHSAQTYNGAAIVQRRVCDALLEHIPNTAAPKRILDAGCGTGYVLPKLQKRFPAADVVALDFSFAMLAALPAPKPQTTIQGDLETLPIANQSLDLYWSSLAVQWCDFAQACTEAHRVLTPNGTLAMATLTVGTFQSLREAFLDVDGYQHTLAFLSPEQIKNHLSGAGFQNIVLTQSSETVFYPDLKTLLTAVKQVGANQVGTGRRRGLLSRHSFEIAEQHYESLRTEHGLPLTYEVVMIYANAAKATHHV